MNATPTLEEMERAIAIDPTNAELRYLFGAELAQRREYPRAAIEFSTALQLAPSLHTARLQLGLLQLSMGQPQQAVGTLAPMESLPAELYWMTLFQRGLTALAQDQLPESLDWLTQGVEANTVNLPLNGDMTLLINAIRQRVDLVVPAPAAAPQRVAPPLAEQKPAVRTDFSKYGGDSPTRH
jgi:tetratricopeptide (TPR) repeat protein